MVCMVCIMSCTKSAVNNVCEKQQSCVEYCSTVYNAGSVVQ